MRITAILIFGIANALFSTLAWAQAVVQITRPEESTGFVESVSAGSIVIKTSTGEVLQCRIQGSDSEGVALSSGILLRFPAEVSVTGEQSIATLKPGQVLKFIGKVSRLGKTDGEATEIRLVDAGEKGSPLTVQKDVKKADEFATCEIIGTFMKLVGKRMLIKVGANSHTRQANLAFAVAEDATIKFKSSDYRRAAAGAKVKRLVSVKTNSGDVLVQSLEIEMSTKVAARSSVDVKLALKYRHLSDDPIAPRPIRSQHFLFMSDISERQAAILLDKLETMVTLLSAYFGSAPRGMVEGFIVRDLNAWPAGSLKEPEGISKIQERAGICFSYSLGNQRRAILYSCDDHGVVQHESTHAFCTMTFGSTGPTWLAEGVAEMGNYWKQGELAVEISPIVMSYIQNAESKKQLLEIAVPGRTESGTWQDYAWRWALCHLLAYNPNYSDRFKPLAVALMQKRPNASFEIVYGPVGREISFEYDQFLKNLDNGYRADLCAWQWNVRPRPLQGERRLKKTIKAQAGWQASSVELVEGTSYDVAAQGYWKIAKDGSEYDAEGDKDDRGKLMGAIYYDYQLSDPFPIGKRLTFKAPIDGHLVLRCQDNWNQLGDNDGELTVHLRLTPPEGESAEKK
jgi:hypothetical protein